MLLGLLLHGSLISVMVGVVNEELRVPVIVLLRSQLGLKDQLLAKHHCAFEERLRVAYRWNVLIFDEGMVGSNHNIPDRSSLEAELL